MENGKYVNEAFAMELMASQRQPLGYIITPVPSFTDAEDILQNTDDRIVRKADEYDKVDCFGACNAPSYYVDYPIDVTKGESP